MKGTLSFLLDTNVWLDHYLARPEEDNAATNLLRQAVSHEHVSLLYSPTTAKDMYFILERTLKELARHEGAPLPENAAEAARETAWACVANMSELATAAPLDESALWIARKFRRDHSDFEDNIIIAAGERANVDYIVTSDQQLLAHMPAIAITPKQACEFISQGDGKNRKPTLS